MTKRTENLRVSVGDIWLKRPAHNLNRVKVQHSATSRASELSGILNQNDVSKAFNASTRTTSPKPSAEVDVLRRSLNFTKVQLD